MPARPLRFFFFISCFGAVTALAAPPHAGGGDPVPRRSRAQAPSTIVQSNAFAVTRPLLYYEHRLGLQFLRDLAALGPDAHWIDGGSGEGVAIEQYLQVGSNPAIFQGASDEEKEVLQQIAHREPGERAHVTGITYHMLRQARPDYHHHLRHLVGRLMEDIPDAEIGKADLISDVYGVFGYSNRLDQAMAKYLTALKPHGKFYLFADHIDRTTVNVNGRSIPVVDWLRTISGIQIEQSDYALVITKTGGPIRIPRLQEVEESYTSGGARIAPPIRVFNQSSGNIEVPVGREVAGPGVDFTRHLTEYVPAGSPRPLSDEAVQMMDQMLGYSTRGGTAGRQRESRISGIKKKELQRYHLK